MIFVDVDGRLVGKLGRVNPAFDVFVARPNLYLKHAAANGDDLGTDPVIDRSCRPAAVFFGGKLQGLGAADQRAYLTALELRRPHRRGGIDHRCGADRRRGLGSVYPALGRKRDIIA